MKRLAGIVGIMILVTVIASPVFAQGWGRGQHMMWGGQGDPGNCPRFQAAGDNLTDEQRDRLNKLHQEFVDRTAPLRGELWAREGEFRALIGTSSPDVEKLKALQKEISDLRSRMDQERLTFQFEVRKINPDARLGMGYGRGSGPRMQGRGPGMGNNCPGPGGGSGMMGNWHQRGGNGQGSCWN